MKKIKLNYLAAYLPYKVKAIFAESNKPGFKTKDIGVINAIYDDSTIVCHDTVNSSPTSFKLLLKPITELTDQEILKMNLGEMISWDIKSFRDENPNYKKLSGYALKSLLKNHFDVFGLIDEGLAENINKNVNGTHHARKKN